MILFCDFTPRVPIYDSAILNSLIKIKDNEMIFLTDPHSFNYYYSEDIREIIFHKNSSLLRLLKIIGIFYLL